MKKQNDGGSEYPSEIGRDNKRASKIRRTHSQSTQEPIYSSIMQRSLVRQIMFRVCGSNVDFSGFDVAGVSDTRVAIGAGVGPHRLSLVTD